MRRIQFLIIVCLFIQMSSSAIKAQSSDRQPSGREVTANRLITFNGTVKDGDGQPRLGVIGITFSLYASQEGGDALWRESQTVQTDEQGRYTILLGATEKDGLPLEVFSNGKAQWLGVQVQGEEEQPRVLLVAVPYALKAADADTVGGKPLSSFVLYEDLAKAVGKNIPFSVIVAQNHISGSANPSAHSASVGVGSGTRVQARGGIGPFNSNEVGNNTWFGENAGASITTGSNNSFFGYNAGNQTTGGVSQGSSNSFFGSLAGYSNTTGYYNSFFGTIAGYSNTTGYYNSFFGTGAGNSNSTGIENSLFGTGAGISNTTGNYNSFYGRDAGRANTVGGDNSFFGTAAGRSNATGNTNSFFGRSAGYSNTSGVGNAFFGQSAGYYNVTGQLNSFFGAAAGNSNTVENNNSFIGSLSNGVAGITNATAIGYRANVAQSNSLVLGSIAGINGADASTNVGIGTTAPKARFEVIGPIYSSAWGPLTGSGLALLYDQGTGLLLSYDSVADHALDFAFRGSTIDLRSGYYGNTSALYVDAGGNIGIGTKAPTQKLHIVGNLRLQGSFITSAPETELPDYVFDRDYKLMGIGELAQYIEKEKHLPNVPKASEIKEKGLNLSEFQMKLLEKIEELTLYTVQQAKTIDRKDAEISALNARLSAVEQMMDRLTNNEIRKQN